MKDCCQPDAPKGKFRRLLDTLTTAIIVLLMGGGLVFTLIHYLRG